MAVIQTVDKPTSADSVHSKYKHRVMNIEPKPQKCARDTAFTNFRVYMFYIIGTELPKEKWSISGFFVVE